MSTFTEPELRAAVEAADNWGTRPRRSPWPRGRTPSFSPCPERRNPYPGKLGVVEEGALADLLLIDGDPLQNIKLIADPARSFLVIMKDGKIYKNVAH